LTDGQPRGQNESYSLCHGMTGSARHPPAIRGIIGGMKKIPRAYLELLVVILVSAWPLWLPVTAVIVIGSVVTAPEPIPLVAGAILGASAIFLTIRFVNRYSRSRRRSLPPDAP
jgi:hypothetical protein